MDHGYLANLSTLIKRALDAEDAILIDELDTIVSI